MQKMFRDIAVKGEILHIYRKCAGSKNQTNICSHMQRPLVPAEGAEKCNRSLRMNC